ncbi:Fc receptor-like protein 5 isoform X2 [Scyliorhinus canicula]|uniref:Fc receptor-like protein 5 isoform X2 n=1 Tax=Scyliorhinus canicula TaxID=7830 RepID=UPI0018F3351E|nr:Fc receptor-like protein 5 isoform X2 [Scyliorhinus canicula]
MLKIIVPFLTLLLIEMNKTETQKGVSINTVTITFDAEEDIRRGSKIILTCSASILKHTTERIQIVYLFYKGQDKGVLLEKVTSDALESQYIIQSARVSHSGYYHCVVEAGTEKKKSESTFITVTGNVTSPLLTIQPMDVIVGDSIELHCASDEIPPLTFIFFKFNGPKAQRLKDVRSNEKFAVHQLKVAANTGKNYSCQVQASGINYSRHSKIVQITVQDPFSDPVLEIEPSDTIFEGDSLTIRCMVNFTPLFLGVQPQMMIVKDAIPITTIYNTTTAVFTTTAALNDTGEYECIAKWKEAMKMTKRKVIVKVPVSEPTLKSKRTGDNVLEGDTLDLSCAVLKGSYPITYKFYKVTTDAALYQKSLNATEAVYSITSVNSEHHGTYSCEASNTVNQRNQTKRSQYVTITVKVPVSNPTIKGNSLKDVHKTGEVVTLLCHSTTGTLPITYSLFLNKRFIYSASKSNTEPAAFKVLINETNDGGEYKCKAENEIPNLFKYSEGMNFTVKVPVSTPLLYPLLNSTEVKLGETMTLHCITSTGTPPITYTLYRNQSSLQSVSTMQAIPAVFKITIATMEHSGEYRCKAENQISSQRSDGVSLHILIPVSTPLLYPLLISTEVKLGETMTLHCITSTGTPPITYTLYRNLSSLQSVSTMQAIPAVFNITIETMEHSGEYRCKAENQISSRRSKGISLHISNTSWWKYIIISVSLAILVAAAILSLCLIRLCKNKDISQVDESDGTHQGEPLQHIQGSRKGSMEIIYSKVGKMIHPSSIFLGADADRNHEGDYTNIMQPEGNGANTDRNHEGDYTYITLPEGKGSDSESDCDGDYTNVSSKRKAANTDSDSCSDENDAIQYTQIDLTALQSGNMPQPLGHTVYASIALDKIQQGSP